MSVAESSKLAKALKAENVPVRSVVVNQVKCPVPIIYSHRTLPIHSCRHWRKKTTANLFLLSADRFVCILWGVSCEWTLFKWLYPLFWGLSCLLRRIELNAPAAFIKTSTSAQKLRLMMVEAAQWAVLASIMTISSSGCARHSSAKVPGTATKGTD